MLKEPCIPTDSWIRKPDLIVKSKADNTSYVIDLTVCADNTQNINDPRQRKINYYNTPQISTWVLQQQRTDRVCYDAVVFNWRGAIAPLSLKLLQKIGIPKYKAEIMSVKVLEGSFLCWLAFKKSTFRT